MCTRCAPGTQSNSDKTGCVGCAAVGATAFSVDGKACISCPGLLVPSTNRSDCEDCPASLLSVEGSCRPACDVLRCQNSTLESAPNTGGQYALIKSIQQLCDQTSKFLDESNPTSASRNVTTDSGSCGPGTACSIRVPSGKSTVVSVRATAGSTSALCRVGVYVKAARLELKPTTVLLTTLSTSSVDASLSLSNAGDGPIVVAQILFDSSSVTGEWTSMHAT